MPNPFQAFSGGNMPGPFGNMQQMIQQFNQFKNSFTGDPKQAVQNMLNSGRISQDDLNRAQEMARQLMNILPK